MGEGPDIVYSYVHYVELNLCCNQLSDINR